MKICITGGAGFIGSHLAESLNKNHEVLVIDNFDTGKKSHIPKGVDYKEIDIREDLPYNIFDDVDSVFHFAANAKVNTFPEDRDIDFETNLKGTKNVLEACANDNVENFVYASSSVVYGENSVKPTPEEHPFDPISMYGATKAGGEYNCKVYSKSFNMDLTILRLANIIGKRNQKGVIYDFIKKLENNTNELEILGDGKQRKSYLHIDDAVKAIIKSWKSNQTTFNIASSDNIDVDKIAEIVSEEMGVNPSFNYTGGDRGWEGDVPEMKLDITRLKNEGWKPDMNSRESVRQTVKELL